MSQPFIGQISIFAGNFAPRGWAFCQGQLLPISQYTALFSILGTMYGGNGTTNFGLPNLQGSVAIGMGQGPGLSDYVEGQVGGSSNVTLLTSNIPSHNHPLQAGANPADSDTPEGTLLGSEANVGMYAPGVVPNQAMGNNAIGITGSGFPLGIMNPFLSINYIIALQGVFPARN
ncbi:phage tail protein [Methylovulum miyakonense]|uniref:phage tail protein n=1 Tax=Methylovulum miyakonense TaxID=645578 RepID=UPI000374ABB9|nr:tail fiber protein [Methylovulum miyakonense]